RNSTQTVRASEIRGAHIRRERRARRHATEPTQRERKERDRQANLGTLAHAVLRPQAVIVVPWCRDRPAEIRQLGGEQRRRETSGGVEDQPRVTEWTLDVEEKTPARA